MMNRMRTDTIESIGNAMKREQISLYDWSRLHCRLACNLIQVVLMCNFCGSYTTTCALQRGIGRNVVTAVHHHGLFVNSKW